MKFRRSLESTSARCTCGLVVAVLWLVASLDAPGWCADKAITRSDSREAASHEVRIGDLYALIVGISDYKDPRIPKLAFSHKDARAFAAFLGTHGALYKKTYVSLLVNEKAMKSEIEKRLYYDLRRSGKDDTVIVFLSGHGADDPKTPGEFFFLSYESDPDYLAASAVHMNRQWFLSKLESKRVLVIADSCHSGGFLSEGIKAVRRSLGKILTDFHDSEGRIFLSSSRADQYSIEKRDVGAGLFTHFLIAGLRGEADTNGDGVVGLQELYEFVYVKTKDESNGMQHPQMAGRMVGLFPLAAPGLMKDDSPAPPPKAPEQLRKPTQPAEGRVSSPPRSKPRPLSQEDYSSVGGGWGGTAP